MRKILPLLLLIAVVLSACTKNKNNTACGTQVCTAEFVSLGILATNKADAPVIIKDLKLINKRTNKAVTIPAPAPAIDFVPNFILIASDQTKGEFSTDGGDLEVTATNTANNQTKTIILKISGGCNCHIAKISGPEKIVFD